MSPCHTLTRRVRIAGVVTAILLHLGGFGALCAQQRTQLPGDLIDFSVPPSPEAPTSLTEATPDGVSDELQSEILDLRRRVNQLERQQSPPLLSAEPGKLPSVKWSGQVQSDFYWFNQSDASREAYGDIENGSAFRRARFGMYGDHGSAIYRIEFDFALSGRPSFLDVFAGVQDVPFLGRVRVGHFFEPFSLERITPNRYTTFMERALTDQAFAPARNTGIMANNTAFDERVAWGIGYFRESSDAFGDGTGDNFDQALTARVTHLLVDEDEGRELLHVGTGYSFRGASDEQVRFRSQPEARIGATLEVPFFVDTGVIPADHYQLSGWELAMIRGPLSIQTEYMFSLVDAQLEPTLCFQGGYVQLTYFLTGEYRPYDRSIGAFTRVIPIRELNRVSETSCGLTGVGAWELAFRVSHLDLNDGSVQGGRITDITAGVNWYLNRYLRVTANYVHAFANDPAVGDTNTDIFATRVNFDF